MALPVFSKSGVSPVTLSRANIFPDVSPLIFNRFVHLSDANTVRVSTVGVPLQTLVVEFQLLTRNDRDSLLEFFTDPLINYGAETFTYTDANGVAHSVKYLEPQLALPEVGDDNVSVSLILTKVL